MFVRVHAQNAYSLLGERRCATGRRADVVSLAALLTANRDFLAPREPLRTEGYATESHQRFLVREVLARHHAGTVLPLAIVEDGLLVGRITVSDIVRGPFLSAHLGYWVSQTSNGRGMATAAVAATIAMAFDGGWHDHVLFQRVADTCGVGLG